MVTPNLVSAGLPPWRSWFGSLSEREFNQNYNGRFWVPRLSEGFPSGSPGLLSPFLLPLLLLLLVLLLLLLSLPILLLLLFLLLFLPRQVYLLLSSVLIVSFSASERPQGAYTSLRCSSRISLGSLSSRGFSRAYHQNSTDHSKGSSSKKWQWS